MADDFIYDVFLSHSSKDKAVVRAVAERLRADKLRVWFDEWELKPGDSIPAKIEAGLEHSRVLVLCMSAQAFGSDWATLESQTFRFRDPLNKERRFISATAGSPRDGFAAPTRSGPIHERQSPPCRRDRRGQDGAVQGPSGQRMGAERLDSRRVGDAIEAACIFR
jgi:hypothetical protein